MNLVILGAPGAGKGTQAVFLARRFNLSHISTGDILRNELKKQNGLAESLRHMIEKGRLVPDDVAINLVSAPIKEAEAGNGYILDGFPRNISQARALEGMTKTIDAVIQIVVEDAVIVKRMSGRRICPACGATFHTFYKVPKAADVCDQCGNALIQREDDKLTTVLNRLKIYHEISEPMTAFYRQKKLLRSVSGVGEMQEIFNAIISALKL